MINLSTIPYTYMHSGVLICVAGLISSVTDGKGEVIEREAEPEGARQGPATAHRDRPCRAVMVGLGDHLFSVTATSALVLI